jgi:hypothetical protein
MATHDDLGIAKVHHAGGLRTYNAVNIDHHITRTPAIMTIVSISNRPRQEV